MGLAALERFAMISHFLGLISLVAAATGDAPAPAPATPVAGATPAAQPATPPKQDILVIVGAPGEDVYEPGFVAAAKAWQDAATRAGANIRVLGANPILTVANGTAMATASAADKTPTDRDLLYDWIQKLDSTSSAPAWIVYIGHGTFDNREARLGFRGPDVSAAELATWLKPVRRPIVVVDGSSASAPFLAAVSAPNRVIITATQNGRESNYARFGELFAQAVANPAADLDRDGQTSVLEAFVFAAKQVQDFYKENDRMATEHALIDDNGDQRGTPSDWFNGTRVVKRPQNNSVAPDGARARVLALVPPAADLLLSNEQLQLREQYERQLEQLRSRKAQMDVDAYYTALEALLRKLAAIYVPAGNAPAASATASSASGNGTANTAK
jgi:hypothetical protein